MFIACNLQFSQIHKKCKPIFFCFTHSVQNYLNKVTGNSLVMYKKLSCSNLKINPKATKQETGVLP